MNPLPSPSMRPRAMVARTVKFLEPLEQRITPATFTWIAATGGSWESNANWSVSNGTDLDGVPDGDDDVLINPALVGAIITVSAGGQAALSLSMPGDDLLQINSGGLTITNASTINGVLVGGGGLAATNQLTLTGLASMFTGGNISGSLRIAAGGALAWSAGDFGAGTVLNEGLLTISSTATKRLLGTTLNNAGTVTETGSDIEFQGGTINNQTGALWDIQSDGTAFKEFGVVGSFNNSGTLRKSASVGTSGFSNVDFNNAASGIVDVQTGVLGLSGGGTSAGGTFTVSLGAELNLTGNNQSPTFTGTYTGSGLGKVAFTGSQIVLGAGGVTFNFPSGLFEWRAGDFNGTSLTNAATGFLQITTAATKRLLGVTLNNAGTVVDTGSDLELQGATINNDAGALWNIQGSGTVLKEFGVVGAFNNAGTLRKSVSAGAAGLGDVNFNNAATGAIDVQTGTLNLSGGGTSLGGNFTVSSGAELNLTGNNQSPTFTGTYTGSGLGKVRFTGAGIVLGTGGATFNFPSGLFEWSGGDFSGTSLANAGFLQITTTATKRLLGVTLNNAGTVVDTGSDLELQGATINNQTGALWNIQGSGTVLKEFGVVGAFNNSGTVRKSVSASAAGLGGVDFNNAATGVVDVQTGVLFLSGGGTSVGGNFTVSSGAELNLTGNNQSPTFTGTYTGSGAGKVTFTGAGIVLGAGGVTFNFPAGFFEWSAGDFSGTTLTNAATGFIQITSTATKRFLGVTMNNLGTVVETGSDLELQGATINNQTGALWDLQSNGNALKEFGVVGTFNNAGTLRKSAGAVASSLGNVDFNNAASGVLDVQIGTLFLGGGGTSLGGNFMVSAGAELNLTGNNQAPTFTGTYTGSGAGKIAFTGSGINLGAAGATFDFPAGLFEWSSGDFGAGTLTNTGFIQITNTSTKRLLGTTLNNAGTVVEIGSDLELQGGVINNLASGLWDIKSDGTALKEFGVVGVFNNAGTLRKSAGAGGTSFGNVDFNNADGDVVVQTGTLFLSGGGTSVGGNFVVDAGAELNLTGNNQAPTFAGTFTGSGAGKVAFTGSRINLGAAGATFDFPAGLFEWRNGDFGSGVLTNTGFIQIISTNTKRLLGTTLNNAGTVVESGSDVEFQGGVINNQSGALWDIQSTGAALKEFGVVGAFNNAGTLRKSTLGGEANFGGVDFNNTGTAEVVSGTLSISGGTNSISGTTLNAGTWIARNGATLALTGTALTQNNATIEVHGTGTISGLGSTLATNNGTLALLDGADLSPTSAFTNNGSLVLGAGSVLTAPSFTQGANGRVEFQLGGAPGTNQFGRIVSAGAVTLDGTAAFSFADGFGTTTGQTFTVMTFPSRTGAFADFDGIYFQRTQILDPVLGTTNLVVNATGSVADLDVTSVTFSGSNVSGQNITVDFTVTNNSADFPTFTSAWTDSVYLSLDDKYDPSDKLIGRVAHAGMVAANGSYNGSLTAPLPGAVPANYRIIVVADSRGESPDSLRANNTGASATTIATDVTALTPGVALNGTIANGQDLWFRVDLAANATRSFFADLVANGQAELFVRQLDVPDGGLRDGYSFSSTVQDARVLLNAGRAGTFYIQLHGRETAGAGLPFSLTADDLDFGVTGVDLTSVRNLGVVTFTIAGSRFTPGTAFALVPASGAPIAATKVEFVNPSEAFATFNLGSVSPGLYDVRATDGLAQQQLDDAVTVSAGGTGGRLDFSYTTPRYIRPNGRNGIVTVEFANVGDTDIQVPLMFLSAADTLFKLEGQPFSDGGTQFLAVDDAGPGSVLQPGDRATLTIEFLPKSFEPHRLTQFTLNAPLAGTTIDWDDLEASLRPEGVSLAGWDRVFENFKTRVGDTVGELNFALAEDAGHLALIGERTGDVARLINFEIAQADYFGEISLRFRDGAFGKGENDPNDFRARIAEDGNVRIGRSGDSRLFLPDGKGGYFSPAGDPALVTIAAGAVTLRDTDGTKFVFKAGGAVDYVESSGGNRITTTYDGQGRISGYVFDDGDTMTFTYDGAGKITAVNGPREEFSTFTYDAAGRRTSLTNEDGTFLYGYNTTAGAPAENALTSLTLANGKVVTFAYDSFGRLTQRITSDGHSEISYPSPGVVMGKDFAGNSSTVVLDDAGHLRRFIDPLGRLSSQDYDDAGRLTEIVGPDGAAFSFSYNANGDLTRIVNPLGQVQSFTYDSVFHRLLSATDARGNTTTYQHDAAGRLTATFFADGSVERTGYNADGLPVSLTTRNGAFFTATYDADRQITTLNFPSQSDRTAVGDTNDQLASLTDATGTVSLAYDNNGRVTRVDYPGGRFIEFTYDAAGRRTQWTDNTGFTLKYVYGPHDALSELRDGTNATLVTFTYDSDGRLAQKTFANGTFTTYAYDSANQLSSLVNHAPGGAVQSQFGYTYDVNGNPLTMTTAAGTTTYRYDLAGQLVRAELPGGRAINYSYDAAGNRLAVDDNGNVTNYAVDPLLDQYDSAGGATFGYDADGRMTSRTDASGAVTVYSYNDEDRLVRALDATGTINYEYNAIGQLVAIVDHGTRREFVYDPLNEGQLIAEYDGSGNLVAHFVQGRGLQAQITAGGELRAFGYDGAGNTAQITGAGGAVLNSYAYLPFGEVLSRTETVANSFEFAGSWGLIETGGKNMAGVRLYDPELGRFTTQDLHRSPGANPYTYASNRPTARVDFTGFDSVDSALGDFGEGWNPLNGGFNALDGAVTAAKGFLESRADAAVDAFIAGKGTLAEADVIADAYNSVNGVSKGVGNTGKYLGVAGKGIDGINALNSIRNVFAGKEHWSKGAKDTLLFGLDFVGDAPGVPIPIRAVAKGAGLWDYATDKATSYYFNNTIPPTDITEALGPRGIELYREAIRNGEDPNNPPGPQKPNNTEQITPNDPNNIVGPSGPGADAIPDGTEPAMRFDGFVDGVHTMGYTILFENKPNASAPAQVVKITHQLDSDLDFASFAFGRFGFGAFSIDVPAGLSSYSTTVDATAALGVLVKFDAVANLQTGLVTWTLTSVDPTTGDLPLDPFGGFLPANVAPPEGDGFVTFRVSPKSSVVSGTDIDAQATIIFDLEQPLNTPLVTNTIDNLAPTSVVTAFASATSIRPTFKITWTGGDEAGGSGLLGYNIFFTDNGGPLQPFRTGTTATAARFTGEVGHTYAFFSQAIDNVNNVEALPVTADATIMVVAPVNTVTVDARTPFTFTDTNGDLVTVRLKGVGEADVTLVGDATNNANIDFIVTNSTNAASKLTVTVKKPRTTGDNESPIGDVTVNGSLGSFSAAKSDLTINGFAATGTVKSLVVRDVLRPDPVLADPAITLGGTNVDKTRFTARTIADGFTLTTPGVLSSMKAGAIGEGTITAAALSKLTTTAGALNADLTIAGAVGPVKVKMGVDSSNWSGASFGPISTGAGAFDADIDSVGAIAKITTKGGGLNGQVVARNIGPVSISGGGFGGLLASFTTDLGRTPALKSLTISGGDLTGDVRVFGTAGNVTVKADRAGNGGNITDGQITAAKIGNVTVAKNANDAVVLAGADLGDDFVLGGMNDTFGPGTIGRVKISGLVDDSVFAAGIDPVNGVFTDGDDVILGAAASFFAGLTITLDATDSYFAAGLFKGVVRINGIVVTPATDARFNLG